MSSISLSQNILHVSAPNSLKMFHGFPIPTVFNPSCFSLLSQNDFHLKFSSNCLPPFSLDLLLPPSKMSLKLICPPHQTLFPKSWSYGLFPSLGPHCFASRSIPCISSLNCALICPKLDFSSSYRHSLPYCFSLHSALSLKFPLKLVLPSH